MSASDAVHGGAFIQQGPTSAKDVLAWHSRAQRDEVDVREPSSINLLLLASAKSEARVALNDRLVGMPEDPYAEAVLVELDCWDPGSHESGLAAAKTWLIVHTDPMLTEYVQDRKDFLEERAEHRDVISDAAGVAQLFPLLAVVFAACVMVSMARLAPLSVGDLSENS